ncbi:MAG TPA: peptide-methionine (S)-S-oxide reductase MsrA [Pirellulales bacterium]|nr:peptide-methionine (S)-S-oxide reductase MsrA [Pirellulales bacterium]
MPVVTRGAVVATVVGGVLVAISATALVAAKAPRAKKPATGTKSDRDQKQAQEKKMDESTESAAQTGSRGLEKATFGSGCFWCSEAVFQQLKGVRSVVSGYSGGITENPTYKQVCTGETGHAEVIQITFDPNEIAYPELLEVFWETHDPTTLNRQGNDVGTQYRSAIFYHTPRQKELAEHYKKKLEEEHAFRKPIVTEITEFSEFYPAEQNHQDYYNLNKSQPYCMAVIRPKVSKVKKVFREKLKDPAQSESAE